MSEFDPTAFGRMQAELLAQRRDIDRMMDLQERQTEMLQDIKAQLDQARGGWKIMMLLGGGSAAFGAAIARFFQGGPL